MHVTSSRQAGLLSAIQTCPRWHFRYSELKAAIAEAHKPTAEHSIRVRIAAVAMGAAWGLTNREMTVLSVAAELHDIGKLRVPSFMLDNPGSLTDEEMAVVRQHSQWGAAMVTEAFPEMPKIAQYVLLHHECMDGSGYPYGLSGTSIPVLTKIISVADEFVALTEERPRRPAYSKSEAVHIMKNEDIGKFDPNVLEVVLKVFSPYRSSAIV